VPTYFSKYSELIFVVWSRKTDIKKVEIRLEEEVEEGEEAVEEARLAAITVFVETDMF
jgi:hypothetical protein